MPDDLRDQFPKVRRIVAAMGMPVYELAGFEADDVIGTLTVQAEERGLDTTIVTGDLDMLQIVSPRTKLMTTRQGVQNTIIYDLAKVDERYGLRPDQMIDYKALKGDSTDNIPGVPGVGEKTAAKLIGQFGTLDALFDRHRRGHAGEAARAAARGEGSRPREPRADADRPRRCR